MTRSSDPGRSEANRRKADFSDAYTAPTPHQYLAEMRRVGYQIGEQARPYLAAAAKLLRERNGEAWPAQMLDLGCSYGIGSMFVKYGVSFEELVSFFHSRAPTDYTACVHATRMWLNVTPPVLDIRVVGADVSKPAVRFARDVGALHGTITTNFEQEGAAPDDRERAWLRGCNLVVSTGAIGYVTERTLGPVLHELGRDFATTSFGPLAVFTVLRMFDTSSIEELFAHCGWKLARVPDVRLPQRSFASAQERDEVLALLAERRVDTSGWEDRGVLYADLFTAAPAPEHAALMERMREVAEQTRDQQPLFGAHTQVALGRLY